MENTCSEPENCILFYFLYFIIFINFGVVFVFFFFPSQSVVIKAFPHYSHTGEKENTSQTEMQRIKHTANEVM